MQASTLDGKRRTATSQPGKILQ